MENNKKYESLRVDVLYANGSKRRVSIPASMIIAAKRLSVFRPDMFQGTGFNPLDKDVSNIVAVTRAEHDLLHQPDRRDQATFWLGQMDMQQAAAQMLEDLADGTQGVVCSALIDAAERIRSLAVCEKVKEEISETD